jgi:hypothetical protein
MARKGKTRASSTSVALHQLVVSGENIVKLTPEEQIKLWKALQQPSKLSEAQKRLGAMMRGEK